MYKLKYVIFLFGFLGQFIFDQFALGRIGGFALKLTVQSVGAMEFVQPTQYAKIVKESVK